MESNIRNQKGITLVALVITIIVMLILVAVSVTVAINGGLFTQAKEASNKWEDESQIEADGNIVKVNVNETETTMNIDGAINTLKDRPTNQTSGTDPETPAATITFTLGGTTYTTSARSWAEWVAGLSQENQESRYVCDETGVAFGVYDYGTGAGYRYFVVCRTDEQGNYDSTKPVASTDPIEDGAVYKYW